MAKSPASDTLGTFRFTVRCDGQPVNSAYQLKSFSVSQQVNRIGKAEIVLKASANHNGEIVELDDDMFLPGTDITLLAGYGEEEDVIFEGTVIAVQLAINDYDGLQVTVDCRDHAYAMTQVTTDHVYEDKTDSDIIHEVLRNYSLEAKVRAGQALHSQLVQYQTTDWDFICSRARACGSIVVVDGKTFSVAPPRISGSATLRLTYGVDIIAFNGELSAAQQPMAVIARAWDPNNQSLLVAQSEKPELNDQGNVPQDILAEVTGKRSRTLNISFAGSDMLQTSANAEQMWAGLSRFSGSCVFAGSAKAKVAELVELVGVGSRFSGLAYVGGVAHEFNESGWTTILSIGIPQEDTTLPQQHRGDAAFPGLLIGVVVKIDEDPKRENRIAIELPILDLPTKRIWARLASSWASKSYGTINVPDVGDEVVVGFQHGEVHDAIVLGSLYSGNRNPEKQWGAENNWHGIRTKSGITIGLDDEKKAVYVDSPGGIKIHINDEDKSLSLADMNGNKLSFSPQGVHLESEKGIKIVSQGDVHMQAADELNQSATGGVSIKGENVNIKANATVSVKGTAKAELAASGQAVVKGAMVMIN